jgi:hypothetical protein
MTTTTTFLDDLLGIIVAPELRRRLDQHAAAVPTEALAAVHAWIATAGELLGEFHNPDAEEALGDYLTDNLYPLFGVGTITDVLYDLENAAHRAYGAAVGDQTPR